MSEVSADVIAGIPIADSSTDGFMTSSMWSKLDGIEAGAQVNVQADWEEADQDADSYIQNKPSIPSVYDASLFVSLAGDSPIEWFTANASANNTVNIPLATSADPGLLSVPDKQHIDSIWAAFPNDASDVNPLATSGFVNDAVSRIGSWEVATLTSDPTPVPDVSNPSHKVIYLTKDSGSSATDPWTEWIYDNNDTWQIIGETSIDLTDYATQTYVTQQVSGKVDKVSGYGLSKNDFSDAYKEKLDSIAASAEVNVQSNWTEADSSSDAYILNKPDLTIYATETWVDSQVSGKADKSEIQTYTGGHGIAIDQNNEIYVSGIPLSDVLTSASATDIVYSASNSIPDPSTMNNNTIYLFAEY